MSKYLDILNEELLSEGNIDPKELDLPKGLSWNIIRKVSDGQTASVIDSKTSRSLLDIYFYNNGKIVIFGDFGRNKTKTSLKTLQKDIQDWITKHDGSFKMPSWGTSGT